MMANYGVQQCKKRDILPSKYSQRCILLLCIMFGRWKVSRLFCELFVYLCNLFWIFVLFECLTYDFPPLPMKRKKKKNVLPLAHGIYGRLEKVKQVLVSR